MPEVVDQLVCQLFCLIKYYLIRSIKKILLVATGALHSPTTVNQHGTIPSIAHAISLEVE